VDVHDRCGRALALDGGGAFAQCGPQTSGAPVVRGALFATALALELALHLTLGDGHDALGARLAPHLDEALSGGQQCQREHHPQHADQPLVEQQTEAEHDESLGALHEPTLCVVAERLGLCPLVRDQHGRGHERDRQHHEMTRARRRQVPCHTAEEQRIGQTVGHRIEERAALGRETRRLCDCTVERVGHAGEDEQQQAETQFSRADGNGRAACHGDADDRDDIGSDTGVAQALADRGQTPLDRRPPMAVEHSSSWMSACRRRKLLSRLSDVTPELRRIDADRKGVEVLDGH
jgi:hypothetical protein